MLSKMYWAVKLTFSILVGVDAEHWQILFEEFVTAATRLHTCRQMRLLIYRKITAFAQSAKKNLFMTLVHLWGNKVESWRSEMNKTPNGKEKTLTPTNVPRHDLDFDGPLLCFLTFFVRISEKIFLKQKYHKFRKSRRWYIWDVKLIQAWYFA